MKTQKNTEREVKVIGKIIDFGFFIHELLKF